MPATLFWVWHGRNSLWILKVEINQSIVRHRSCRVKAKVRFTGFIFLFSLFLCLSLARLFCWSSFRSLSRFVCVYHENDKWAKHFRLISHNVTVKLESIYALVTRFLLFLFLVLNTTITTFGMVCLSNWTIIVKKRKLEGIL